MMKNHTALAAIAAIALMLITSAAVIAFENSDAAGSGTAENPYDSLSASNVVLAQVTSYVNDTYYKVGATVNLRAMESSGSQATIFRFVYVSSGFGLSLSSADSDTGYRTLSGTISGTGDVVVKIIQPESNNIFGYTFHVVNSAVQATSVSISGSSSVDVGGTLTLTATTSPSTATDRTVTWSITSGSNRVSYTTSDTATGGRIVLTGLSAGSVTVRATADGGSNVYATKTINVTEPETLVSSISITGSSSVAIGSYITLTARTSPTDADNRHVYWEISSGSSRATLSNATDTTTGGTVRLTGVSAGSVTVRAYADDGSGVYGTKTITVYTPSISITTSQSDKTITTGNSFSYTVGTSVSGCTVSVSGAPWLSVSGSTIYGSTNEPGEYDVTVTVSKSGYTSATQTFTLTVVSALGFDSTPLNGLIVNEA